MAVVTRRGLIEMLNEDEAGSVPIVAEIEQAEASIDSALRWLTCRRLQFDTQTAGLGIEKGPAWVEHWLAVAAAWGQLHEALRQLHTAGAGLQKQVGEYFNERNQAANKPGDTAPDGADLP